MLKKIYIPAPGLVAVFLFVFIFKSYGAASGDVKVSRASIRLGYSLRLANYSFGQFSCYIENGMSKPSDVTLKIYSSDGFAQNQKNFFSEKVRIPANTGMRYRTNILVEHSENYKLDAYIDGKRKPGTAGTMFVKLLSYKATRIAVLNDAFDKSFGSFTQLPDFKDKYYSIAFSSTTFPDNWAVLKGIIALVVLDPDFKRYSSKQVRALKDYVYQGGIIIWADPEGTAKAAFSPLAELLPVVPLKIRKIKDLPALEKITGGFGGWKTYERMFLESFPRGDGIDILNGEGFPLFRWKRYGLGSCRFSAVSLSGDFYPAAAWQKLLKEFFKHQKHFPQENTFIACLDEMTGFPVPPAIVVKVILLFYFIILATFFILGLWRKRAGTALVAAATAAVVMTLFILYRANVSTARKGTLLSAVEINYEGGVSLPGECYYAFFADRDMTVDIAADTEDAEMRAIPPSRASFLPPGMVAVADRRATAGARITKPLEIMRRDGISRLRNIKLAMNTARQFKVSFSEGGKRIARKSLPLIRYGKTSPGFLWDVPEGYDFEKAFLLFPSGSFPLVRNGNKLSLDMESTSFIQTDRITNMLKTCLDKSVRKTSPAVALVSRLKSGKLKIPEGSFRQGRRVDLFPVKEDCPGRNVYLPPELVVLSPGNTSSRMVMPGNAFGNFMDSRGAVTYFFRFTLPPVFSGIKPEEITVRFEYRNQGGNILATPKLVKKGMRINLPGQGRRGNSTDGKIINPVKSSGNIYTFTGEEVVEALDPLTGSGMLIIKADEINNRIPPAQKIKANKWAPVKLSISIKGIMPENEVPFKY